MNYNYRCLDEQNTRAICFYNAVTTTIGYCGRSALRDRTNVLTVRLSNGRNHEGRFTMARGVKPIEDRMVKKCECCGKEYLSWRNTQKYCSNKCGSRAWRDKKRGFVSRRGTASQRGGSYLPVNSQCEHCGAVYMKNYSQQKYCSTKCKDTARLRRWYPEGGPGKGWSKGMVFIEHEPNKICDMCGKPFFKRPCYLKRGNKYHFCSNECRTKHIGANVNHFPNTTKRSNIGTREDLNLFVRSSWEANYARYLNWLIKHGEIKKWEYEVDTFEFEPIKRGTRFYTPDFKVFNNDGSVEYHEIKGYMDPKSKTKLNRMAKYYPDVKVILIDKDVYYSIASQMKNMIENWEVT